MKQFLLICFFTAFAGLKAQDTLYLKNLEKLPVKLVEINPDNIKYKRFNNLDGPVYSTQKSEINQIVFANGKKEIFQNFIEVKKDTVIAANNTASTLVNPVDTLIFTSGRKMPAKIISINPVDVKYRSLNNPDGPVYSALKSELKEIIFSTGLRQSFAGEAQESISSQNSLPQGSSEALIKQGKADASRYYRHKGGARAVGVLTILIPPLGLIPAVACTFFEPKEQNLGYPSQDLWKKPEYKTAYKFEAYKIKMRRIWITFIACTVAWTALVILSAK